MIWIMIQCEKIIKKKYEGYRVAFITLTYRQAYEVITATIEIMCDSMPAKVRDFIERYLQIMEGKTMIHEDLVSLCGKIYAKYNKTIRMITTYGKPHDYDLRQADPTH